MNGVKACEIIHHLLQFFFFHKHFIIITFKSMELIILSGISRHFFGEGRERVKTI